MILRINVLVIAISLFFCSSLIAIGHAQQAQTETQAVQVIGLAGLKENTKGRLTVVNGTLRFIYARGNADVAAAFIEDVVTGKDSQRVIGGTSGTVASLAAPYGTGSALSLFRKKLDTLTIQYRDADGGLARRDLYDAAWQGGCDQEGTGRARGAHKRSDFGGPEKEFSRFAGGEAMKTNFRNALSCFRFAHVVFCRTVAGGGKAAREDEGFGGRGQDDPVRRVNTTTRIPGLTL